jgi:hypothetical protein
MAAWQEDDVCYNAVLQVCSDYEEGKLWYNEKDYNQWLLHARKHELDVNIDTRPNRRRMERLWLRPLSRVPKKRYLKLAQKTAVRPIEESMRPRQKYFFNNAESIPPKKNTLGWVVDRIQRREAVRNAFRWLTVRLEGRQSISMTDFFAINKKMQTKWAAPIVKSVTTLERYESLIPPMIRQQFDHIAQGGTGYQGYRRVVSNIAEATWDW